MARLRRRRGWPCTVPLARPALVTTARAVALAATVALATLGDGATAVLGASAKPVMLAMPAGRLSASRRGVGRHVPVATPAATSLPAMIVGL